VELGRLVPDGIPRVHAAVVYEQWGWPIAQHAWDELSDRFQGCVLIVDRVDSADVLARPARYADLPAGTMEVASLWKLLGLPGGGLARTASGPVAFQPRPASDALRRLVRQPLAELDGAGYREWFKEGRQAVHPGVLAWLRDNCLENAMEAERRTRQRRVASLLASNLGAGWPSWMAAAVARGAGPVWVPLLRGGDPARLRAAMDTLGRQYGVAAAVRMFNWSGDPLHPAFEPCLALPVHGRVAPFDDLLPALERSGLGAESQAQTVAMSTSRC
jgi:hypothetical protein